MNRTRKLYTPTFFLPPTWSQIFLHGPEYLFTKRAAAKAWRKQHAERFVHFGLLRGPVIEVIFADDERFFLDHVRTELEGVGKAYMIAGPIFDSFKQMVPKASVH